MDKKKQVSTNKKQTSGLEKKNPGPHRGRKEKKALRNKKVQFQTKKLIERDQMFRAKTDGVGAFSHKEATNTSSTPVSRSEGKRSRRTAVCAELLPSHTAKTPKNSAFPTVAAYSIRRYSCVQAAALDAVVVALEVGLRLRLSSQSAPKPRFKIGSKYKETSIFKVEHNPTTNAYIIYHNKANGHNHNEAEMEISYRYV